MIDGTGRPAVAADVGIAADRIVAIGEVAAAATELDAAGLDVAPGFVDIHSHSDYTLLVDPRAVSALHQGVTTEIVGQLRSRVLPDRAIPSLRQRAIYGYSPRCPSPGATAAGYFERLEEARPAVNVASLVPNGQLRLATVGLEDRPATPRRARGDAAAARGVARAGRLGLLDRARVRGRARRAAGRARAPLRALRAGAAVSTRRTRGDATRARTEAVDEAIETARAR